MSVINELSAARIREKLSHPVVDADGHWIEFGPFIRDELRRIGGDRAVQGYNLFASIWEKNLDLTVDQREAKHIPQGGWWGNSCKNTRDRATAMMPELLHERMGELGFDFAVLYPSAGHRVGDIRDGDLRRATCRALNTFVAEYFSRFSDRVTPAAIIPMYTPEEAVAELEYVVNKLGLKVVSLRSMIPRALTGVGLESPGEDAEFADFAPVPSGGVWYDVLGLDSAHDYDVVWQKCVDLRLSPTFHAGSAGVGTRSSPTNFVYNHIGHFAAANEAVCKALFIGGVTRRFPTLKFGFLEGGVGWGCQLYNDLIEHWDKRNLKALDNLNPKNIDTALLLELATKYDGRIAEGLRQPKAAMDTVMTAKGSALAGGKGFVKDDFAACMIERKDEIRELFVDHFYFGCEADDRVTGSAFNPRQNAFDAKLHAMFGSDIGHFDVPNMVDVLPEAYELVEDAVLDTADFRDFVFGNIVRFYGETNPDFFKGTAIEKEAASALT